MFYSLGPIGPKLQKLDWISTRKQGGGWISTFFFLILANLFVFFFDDFHAGSSNFYDSGPIELKFYQPLGTKTHILRFFFSFIGPLLLQLQPSTFLPACFSSKCQKTFFFWISKKSKMHVLQSMSGARKVISRKFFDEKICNHLKTIINYLELYFQLTRMFIV